MNGLTIGKLAKEADIGIETVRFYERQGLVAPPPRTESNYRVYPEEEVARIKFIKRAKALGFTLNEVKDLLAVSHDPHATRAYNDICNTGGNIDADRLLLPARYFHQYSC